MVARKMGSQEGGGSDNNGSTRTRDPLTRQASLYGLTFDEVENQLGDLGKPLSSMNLDELLKNVWAVESCNPGNGLSAGPSNLVKVSGDLSKKTVNEVWQVILQGQKRNFLDRKTSLGEITLADFLVKAGVVAEPRENLGLSRTAELTQQQAQMMNYRTIPSPVFMSENQARGRKRAVANDVVEKIVERRQKRMIKNRESAFRSRARKQAYTTALENKVSRLEEENERLKTQKVFEKMLPSTPPPEPKYYLRRTRSSPI